MTTRPSETLPSFFDELERWAARRGCEATVHAYGGHTDQWAELRLPSGRGPHPLAVVIHGGFWHTAFGLEGTRAVATALAEAGWATWNVEYRRIGAGGGYPATVDDVAAACAATSELNAPIDPTRVIAVGHSAGGHLALLLASRGLLAGVVSLAGVCDLRAAADARLGDGAALELMGGSPEQAPEAWALADPIRRLPTGVPTLLVHGTRDDRVPIAQSRDYARAASAAGDACSLVELDADHFDLVDPRSGAWPRIVDALARGRQ
jgi:acetyl esterase/lipase